MNLRTLLLSFALAGAACNVSVPNQFPCKHPGQTSECGADQICGNDFLCTGKVNCPAGFLRCNGNCVDITTDPQNCGGCGTICNRTKGEACQPPGTPGGSAECRAFCFSGQSNCSGTCRDTTTDTYNCGACGVPCPPGSACTPAGPNGTGQCGLVCQNGLFSCGSPGTCVDRQRDNRNCGDCGTICPTGQVCAGGLCGVSCPTPETKCGTPSQCVNTATDRNNCGTCGTVCPAGHVCQGSNCQMLSCPAPLSDCGTGTCVNTNNDPQHCGNCSTACAAGLSCTVVAGSPTCVLQCPTTPTLQTACPSANPTVCANLQTDPNNCGACGTPCGAGQSCQGGSCKSTCKTGFTDCGGTLGCVDTLNDSNHCAPLATALAGCTAAPCPAGSTCQAGACKPACGSQTLCGSACVDTTNDPNNCGYCLGVTKPSTTIVGQACGTGLACSGGVCQVACGPASSGSVICNGTCVNTKSDNKNCGGCPGSGGIACPAGSICDGTGHCAATCGLNALGQPLATCNGKCVDTSSDANNCGGCQQSSAPTHKCNAGEVCQAGVCTVSCQAGLSPCTQAGGAITCKDLTQDRANCGSCGTTCGAGQVCQPDPASTATPPANYKCMPSCQSALTNCNGVCTNVSVDPNNCGYCAGVTKPSTTIVGQVCPVPANSAAFCASGQCQTTCAAGFAVCDGNPANGCLVNLTSDPLHCGDCKVRCPAPDNAIPTGCSAGVCSSGSLACQPGFLHCDTNNNGCEANLQSDAKNCGGTACGHTPCQGTALTASTLPFCNAGACSATPLGVQQNLLISDLTATATGWTQCSSDTYGSTTSVDAIKTACGFNAPSRTWLVGCGPAGGNTLTVAAAGAPADVLFATSPGTPHVVAATGVEWYFDNGTFGFAPANAALSRAVSACDSAGTASDSFAAGFGSQRLCWLTAAGGASGNVVAGQRCGDKAVGDTTYQRFVFYK
jgi:hypothetical protein